MYLCIYNSIFCRFVLQNQSILVKQLKRICGVKEIESFSNHEYIRLILIFSFCLSFSFIKVPESNQTILTGGYVDLHNVVLSSNTPGTAKVHLCSVNHLFNY